MRNIKSGENLHTWEFPLSASTISRQFASLCWWPLVSLFLGASLYFLLALLFARYLLFYLCLSRSPSRSFHRNSTVLVSSLTFLRVFLDSLYVFYFLFLFWSLSLFLFILFSLKTLSPQTWIITISSRWQCFSSAGIVALRVDYNLRNTENYCSTTTSPVWFRAHNAGCKLFTFAASHPLAHVKPSCNA